MSVQRYILLTGPPGVGKTTLISKIANRLITQYPDLVNGFYTEERRLHGQRVGFDAIDLISSTNRAVLSTVNPGQIVGSTSRLPTVGKYTVLLEEFENFALPILNKAIQGCNQAISSRIVIVDEIGKMESFSRKFLIAIEQMMEIENLILFATVPLAKGKPIELVERLRNNRLTKIYTVAVDNRNVLEDDILLYLNSILQK